MKSSSFSIEILRFKVWKKPKIVQNIKFPSSWRSEKKICSFEQGEFHKRKFLVLINADNENYELDRIQKAFDSESSSCWGKMSRPQTETEISIFIKNINSQTIISLLPGTYADWNHFIWHKHNNDWMTRLNGLENQILIFFHFPFVFPLPVFSWQMLKDWCISIKGSDVIVVVVVILFQDGFVSNRILYSIFYRLSETPSLSYPIQTSLTSLEQS